MFELILLFGFFVALVSLLFASFAPTWLPRVLLIALAFGALVLQAGCLYGLVGVGNAWGGGGDTAGLTLVILIAFFVAIVWSVALISTRRPKPIPHFCPSCRSLLGDDPWICTHCGWSGKVPAKPK